MTQLDKLITNFSNSNLKDFFFHKIPSFEPDADEFSGVVKDSSDFEDPVKVGQVRLEDGNELLVFTSSVKIALTRRSSKKKQFEIARKILKEDFKDGAIFVFYDQKGDFRFSFIRRYYGKDQKYSNWKRFTYYVRPNKQNKTFKKQLDKCYFSTLDSIEAAFNVEVLSKEFYTELSYWYFASLQEVKFPNELGREEHQLNSQAMIRLITRMMFVWFMKQKGLIPEDIFDKSFLDRVLKYEDSTGSTYYKAILQNLFFATLNTEMGEQRKWITTSAYGVQHFYRYKRFFTEEGATTFLEMMKKTPFLNGGLFENLDIVEPADEVNGIPKKDIRVDCFSDNRKNEMRLKVPDYLFFGKRKADISTYLDDKGKNQVEVDGLIDILNRYDFTIDENSQDDQEVALDPELLGTVFENLLASYNPETQSTARKESGSFYTPRLIVNYMVKESLFYYLQDKSKIEEQKLRPLLDLGKTEELNEEDKKTLVEYLTRIKILDPACGSGAFPVGALQEMVRLLNLLDPGNKIYKEKLKERLKEELQSTIDRSDYEELKINIEEVFANQYNDPDYARKLFLIQNCLFGVDIQSIAMQITKLRFFISLLVDQHIDPEKENLGIKPLPNLETKFVAANTLVGLQTQDGVLKNLELQDLEDDLSKVREKYFGARTYTTKRKYRVKIKELRDRISAVLVEDGWATDTAKQISQWDPFNQNSSSNWFDSEWMFGVKKFDLVIGNPPYIQLQKALPGEEVLKFADLYKNEGFKTFERTGDIYALFYERGLDLAKNGFLCYITSNKWMRAKYGKSLRQYFATKQPLKLLDLGPGIFEAATVDTNILIVRDKKVKEHHLLAFTLKNKQQVEFLDDLEMTVLKDPSEDSWVILRPIEQSIKEKIERLGTPLKDWDIQINYGIKTGYNKAFIINGEVRKRLIEEDPKSAEIIRPILRGRDIKRYSYEFSDLWLITTFPSKHINIDDYPAVKSFLFGFKPKLIQTGRLLTTDEKQNMITHASQYGIEISFTSKEKSRKKTTNEWFETQDSIDYWEDFYKPKIVWKIIGSNINFFIDTEEFFFNNAANILTSNTIHLEDLVGFLNSRLFEWYFKKIVFIEVEGGGIQMFNTVMNKIPIPVIDGTEMGVNLKELVTAVSMKNLSRERENTTNQKIDSLIHSIFKLTKEEVKFIESQ